MTESAAYARRGYLGGAKQSTVPAGISDVAVSLTGADLSTWAGVSSNGPFMFVLDPGLSTEEVCEATALSGNNITGITRGRRNTSAVTHSANCVIKHVSTDRDFDEANRLVNAILGISGLTAGDLLYVLTATTFARLAKGTARQALLMNAGATAPAWGDSLASLLTASGDIPYASAANTPARLAKSTDGKVLTLASGVPAWAGFVGASVALITADQSINNATNTAVQFNTEFFDTSVFHDNVTNNTRFTIPTTGYYLIEYNITFAANATGVRAGYLYVNGANTAELNGAAVSSQTPASAADNFTISDSHIVHLTAADYVEVFAYQSSGGSLALKTNYTAARIALLGV